MLSMFAAAVPILANAATPGPAPEAGKDAPVATTPEATPPPAVTEETKPEPAPAKTAGKGKKKDCKMDVGFAVITYPCPN